MKEVDGEREEEQRRREKEEVKYVEHIRDKENDSEREESTG